MIIKAQSNKKIYSLQYLRAFAAIWVLITHVLQRLDIHPGGVAFAGQWGVDIFFLLSGFIIYYTTNDHSSWKSFALKRVFRIYPAYLVCLAVYCTYSLVYNGDGYNLLTIFQNIVMVPFSGPIGFNSLIVGQAWSTCYEMYFYTLLALLLFAGVSKKWLLPLITVLFVFGFTIWRYYPSGGFCGYLLSLFGAQHVLFFCEGIVIALMASRIQRFEIKKCLLKIIAMLSLMAYIAIMCCSYNFFTSLIISPVFFIVVYKANEIASEKGIVHRSMFTLGDISFSIYLIHSVVIRFLLNQCHIDGFWSLLLLTLVVTILLSLLCYTLIEKRFIGLGKQLSMKFI